MKKKRNKIRNNIRNKFFNYLGCLILNYVEKSTKMMYNYDKNFIGRYSNAYS